MLTEASQRGFQISHKTQQWPAGGTHHKGSLGSSSVVFCVFLGLPLSWVCNHHCPQEGALLSKAFVASAILAAHQGWICELFCTIHGRHLHVAHYLTWTSAN